MGFRPLYFPPFLQGEYCNFAFLQIAIFPFAMFPQIAMLPPNIFPPFLQGEYCNFAFLQFLQYFCTKPPPGNKQGGWVICVFTVKTLAHPHSWLIF